MQRIKDGRVATPQRDVQALTLRVPREIYEAMRTFAFATDTTINDVGIRSIQNFLSTEGHHEEVEAHLRSAENQYRVALDKLADL